MGIIKKLIYFVLRSFIPRTLEDQLNIRMANEIDIKSEK
jgi:hypothetical protein